MSTPAVDGATGSLRGLRVVDLTTNVAGPWATQILGDLGADVIKVERDTGDDTRGWGPPFWPGSDESVSFSALNRSKRSIVLDLKTDEGTATLDRLIVGADVVIQNMRAGAFERLGYSWGRLQELNPDLVYADMSGFGHEGPRSHEPAYDPLMQAYSGLMSLTGEDGRPPVRIPVSVLDKGTGMWAVIGIFDALRKRDAGQGGTHLQFSLLETALAWIPGQLLGHVVTGRVPRRLGSATSGIAPYQAFETADGYLIVAAGNQRIWQRLCEVLERPDLVEDPRYVDNASRFQNLSELSDDLTAVFRTRVTDDWIDRLQAAQVPCSPINTVDKVVADDQVQALGTIERLPHPRGGHDYGVVHLPIRRGGDYHAIERLAPRLDEHGDEIRAELGE